MFRPQCLSNADTRLAKNPKGPPLKKLFSLLSAIALVLTVANPARAGSEYLNDLSGFNSNQAFSNLAAMTYSGSLVEGQQYTVSASGVACETGPGSATIGLLDYPNSNGGLGIANIPNATGNFSISSNPRVAGPAGTSVYFHLFFHATQSR